ncbi:MAG: FAD:protein FMN transferase [Lachnospiraceae bacterium]|nr:FAD:protein FMN transferase [Lachnospiraceae bacterium]
MAVFVTGRGRSHKEGAEPIQIQGFAFDTTYQITLYEGGDRELLQKCISLCSEYENIISRTKEGSEVNNINSLSKEFDLLLTGEQKESLQKGNPDVLSEEECRSYENKLKQKLPEAFEKTSCRIHEDGSISYQIFDFLKELVQFSEEYGTLSKGCFTMAIEPVSSQWDFTAENAKVPQETSIENALPYVTGAEITLTDDRMQFALPGTAVEFGGIAKGYVADCLKDILMQGGVTSALIDLGGNILCIGDKPGGESFRIGIQQPFADRKEVIATVAVKDVSVVSSGIYERYFEQDGNFYHHILNPMTGYPVENDLMAVTIISEKSVDGDGLSTTCFGLGLEQGMELINSMEDVTAVFITKDEKMHYADGFENYMVK